MAVDENRHVGAEFESDPLQLRRGQLRSPQAVQRQQHGGGIRTAAAQPAAQRQPLGEADLDALADAGGLLQQARGAHGEVLFRRHAGQRRRQQNLAVIALGEMQAVAEIEEPEDRLQ